MTHEERIREDEAQLEYIREWKERKRTRKVCRKLAREHLIKSFRYLWLSVKGAVE